MSMYECKNCGNGEATFPKIILSINSDEEAFPDYHNNEFEKKFDEFASKIPHGEGTYYRYQPVWDAFHKWLGDKTELWFCSIECAINFLVAVREGEIDPLKSRNYHSDDGE